MDFIPCSAHDLITSEAAHHAISINPANRPAVVFDAGRLAVLVSKYWGQGGVKLTVQFLDNPDAETRRMILSDEIGCNAWSKVCNAQFVETQGHGDIRVLRNPRDGYWSNLGTDLRLIPPNQQTMNLANFTSRTLVSEYKRVVKHEFGHSLGFPHEHMRAELVARLDPQKTIQWGAQVLGWDEEMVRSQILTALNSASIRGTVGADQNSIMCYQLPGTITVDGQPIVGGVDIDELDAQFAGTLYPLLVKPPPPPPSGSGPTFAQAQDAADAAIEAYAAGLPWQWLFGSTVRSVKSPVDAALKKLWK